MNTIESLQVRELSAAEVDDVSGGFVWIGAFVGGAAVGYGIRKGVEAFVDWLFD
jgi:hypothetical protein